MSEKKVIVIGKGKTGKIPGISKPQSYSQNDVAKAILDNWKELDEEEVVVVQPLFDVLDVFKHGKKTEKGFVAPNAAGISLGNAIKRSLQEAHSKGIKITPQLLIDAVTVKKNGIEYTICEAKEKAPFMLSDEEQKLQICAEYLQAVCDANGIKLEGTVTTK